MSSAINVLDEVLAHGQKKTCEQRIGMEFEVPCCCCLTQDSHTLWMHKQYSLKVNCGMSFPRHICGEQDVTLHIDENRLTKNVSPRHCLCQATYNKFKVLKILNEILKNRKWENNPQKCHWILQDIQISILKNPTKKLCCFGKCLVFYINKKNPKTEAF